MNILRFAQTRPFAFNIISTSVLSFFGDGIAQQFDSDEGYSLKRGLRMGLFGMLVSGPPMYCWFKYINQKIVGRSMRDVMKKVLLTQSVVSPIMNSTFFGYIEFWKQIDAEVFDTKDMIESYRARIKGDLIRAMSISTGFWIPAQMVNFKFTPSFLQLPVTAVYNVIWCAIISYIGYRKKQKLKNE
eukprot:TRINITY_DN15418_c0_g1_i1.p1 TRINITY_DN15418_c0_g1~~TRINITY_DN15418_c0_g1_i1.p1  ORF type:complete len:186 (-),score=31.94 TRINITY_DN15418_c0_g1_i1:121-678(-)